MKKILQIAAVTALTFSAIESKAQLHNGSIAPDWTFTDINGVSHHLYADLASGKTVYIDVSATWCGPCWNYHNTGALESLWVNHGPTGGNNVSNSTTNDCMVYFIEGDGTTTSADLNGTGSNTQGNWVAGVSHPIIDPVSPGVFNTNYAIAYFPTIYMICPDRVITEVGQVTATALYAARSTCNIGAGTDDAEIIPSSTLNLFLASCDSVTPTFRLADIGSDTLTSATLTYKVDGVTQRVVNWTGVIAPYDNTFVTGTRLGASTAGTHSIQMIVSNPNGVTDPTSANNTATASCAIYPGASVPAISQDFETAGIPSTWAIINHGDAATWMDATTGFNSSKSAKLGWYGMTAGDIDYVELDPQSFANFSSVSMTFEVAYPATSTNDKLMVEVSTNCGMSWSTKYTRSGAALSTTTSVSGAFTPSSAAQWRLETVNLNSYAGQSAVWVRFKATSDNGNNVYVDNINFTAATGIQQQTSIGSVNVFPNPATTNVNVNFDLKTSNNVTMTLVNSLGQVVRNENLGNLSEGEHNYSLNTEMLDNGFYFLTITSGENTFTTKVAVNK